MDRFTQDLELHWLAGQPPAAMVDAMPGVAGVLALGSSDGFGDAAAGASLSVGWLKIWSKISPRTEAFIGSV